MSVSLQIDQKSMEHLNSQLQLLKTGGKASVSASMVKVAYKIADEAKLRLKGQQHVVTARLMNSIFVKTKDKEREQYQDNLKNSFTVELPSVAVDENNIAVGTNVEYAEKIETKYPFLSWAVRNIDVLKSITEQSKLNFNNIMKFGKGIIPQIIRDAKPKGQHYSTFAKSLEANPRQKGETYRKYAQRLKK